MSIGAGQFLNSQLVRHINQDAVGIGEMKHSVWTCGKKSLPRFSLISFACSSWPKRRIPLDQGGEVPLIRSPSGIQIGKLDS